MSSSSPPACQASHYSLVLEINVDKLAVIVFRTGTNGSRDILAGIDFALQHLNFRPGASKTLILFPCSSCQPQDMTTVSESFL